jgi:hypothetical protein
MSRRIILIVLVIVVVIVGLFVVLRTRGAFSSSGKNATATPTSHATALAGTTTIAAATTPVPTPVRSHPAVVTLDQRNLDAYASALLPVLNRGTGTVDSIVKRAQGTSNLGQLSKLCFNSLKPLGIAQAQADGVAHPYPWWSRVGKLHHRMMGIYHQIVGAADECSTAAGNGQGSDASAAVSIMAQQAGALHGLQGHVASLARGPQ